MISDEFRASADGCHRASGGSQNAQLRVIFLEMVPGGAKRHVWLGNEKYAGQGDHTEKRLIARFWNDLDALRLPHGTVLRLTRVEVYTRFNTCLHCTNDLSLFQRDLQARMTEVIPAKFDVADRGNLYIPNEGKGQISISEAQFRKEAASTQLRMTGWTVSTTAQGGLQPTDLSTLGTRGDPIVLI